MTAMNVFGVVYPFVLLVIAAAVWLGVRSSGRERTHASALEQRLREHTFTGQDRVTLEWPRDRRRPCLARVAPREVTAIHLGPPSLTGSSGQPGRWGEQPS